MPAGIFIETEPLGKSGEGGERIVWEAVRQSFTDGQSVAIRNYRIFSRKQQIRWEPDILIATKELGLIIIEVKSCRIDEIIGVEATQWQMAATFYSRYIYPYQQAENQLFALLKHCNKKPALREKVPGRVIVALPIITREEWRRKGFDDQHHTCPPIIFKDELDKSSLLNCLQRDTVVIKQGCPPLNDNQWKLLQEVVCGPKPPELSSQSNYQPHSLLMPPRSSVITGLKEWTNDIDWQQVQIGMQIPPGPQRIRGIAGSGKTILLCQKAVRMHLKYPAWDIALVFFTRSLYELMVDLVDKWIRYFSDGEIGYNPDGKLKILHAWGERSQPGLYSTIAAAHDVSKILEEPMRQGSPPERLAFLCKRILRNYSPINPMFDAILIDEGQDLALDDDELKYEEKQAIYWLAWQVIRPVEPDTPDNRRLIWAYDEAQSLASLTIPTVLNLFGRNLSKILTQGTQYQGGINKAEVMKRCYRTPGPILTAAHAIGMGILRPEGLLSAITTKEGWEAIGYEVEGDFRRANQPIMLHRPSKNSPNPVPQLWNGPVLEFETYNSRLEEVTALAKKIKHNLDYDGLKPSRDILVIALGSPSEAKKLENYIADFLKNQDINIFIPSALECNVLNPIWPNRNSNNFWHDGAVTVSRVHRAKGNEAFMVYVVGFDNIAKDESNISLRNQLLVALTRAKAWVNLSNVGESLMCDEMQQVIASGNSFTFTYKRPPKQTIGGDDTLPVQPLAL